ncbi:hypothetical protein Pcinc_028632 [Petrolisthes cinctipes]|uniref:Uncharacterized protein n=1 Tax=Petrolisthes cinctipes TaxID=88211 RepID=A0AAE1F1M6_PETCI|nr:hypothetical protein Pcinc_028632 [Petrolisthes cinctipes]
MEIMGPSSTTTLLTLLPLPHHHQHQEGKFRSGSEGALYLTGEWGFEGSGGGGRVVESLGRVKREYSLEDFLLWTPSGDGPTEEWKHRARDTSWMRGQMITTTVFLTTTVYTTLLNPTPITATANTILTPYTKLPGPLYPVGGVGGGVEGAYGLDEGRSGGKNLGEGSSQFEVTARTPPIDPNTRTPYEYIRTRSPHQGDSSDQNPGTKGDGKGADSNDSSWLDRPQNDDHSQTSTSDVGDKSGTRDGDWRTGYDRGGPQQRKTTNYITVTKTITTPPPPPLSPLSPPVLLPITTTNPHSVLVTTTTTTTVLCSDMLYDVTDLVRPSVEYPGPSATTHTASSSSFPTPSISQTHLIHPTPATTTTTPFTQTRPYDEEDESMTLMPTSVIPSSEATTAAATAGVVLPTPELPPETTVPPTPVPTEGGGTGGEEVSETMTEEDEEGDPRSVTTQGWTEVMTEANTHEESHTPADTITTPYTTKQQQHHHNITTNNTQNTSISTNDTSSNIPNRTSTPGDEDSVTVKVTERTTYPSVHNVSVMGDGNDMSLPVTFAPDTTSTGSPGKAVDAGTLDISFLYPIASHTTDSTFDHSVTSGEEPEEVTTTATLLDTDVTESSVTGSDSVSPGNVTDAPVTPMVTEDTSSLTLHPSPIFPSTNPSDLTTPTTPTTTDPLPTFTHGLLSHWNSTPVTPHPDHTHTTFLAHPTSPDISPDLVTPTPDPETTPSDLDTSESGPSGLWVTPDGVGEGGEEGYGEKGEETSTTTTQMSYGEEVTQWGDDGELTTVMGDVPMFTTTTTENDLETTTISTDIEEPTTPSAENTMPTPAQEDISTAGDGDLTTVGTDMTTVGTDMTTVGQDMTTEGQDMTTERQDMTTEGTDMTTEGTDMTTLEGLTTVGTDMTTLEGLTTVGTDMTTLEGLTTIGTDITTVGTDMTTLEGLTTIGEGLTTDEVTTVEEPLTTLGEELTTVSEGMTTTTEELTTGTEDLTTTITTASETPTTPVEEGLTTLEEEEGLTTLEEEELTTQAETLTTTTTTTTAAEDRDDFTTHSGENITLSEEEEITTIRNDLTTTTTPPPPPVIEEHTTIGTDTEGNVSSILVISGNGGETLLLSSPQPDDESPPTASGNVTRVDTDWAGSVVESTIVSPTPGSTVVFVVDSTDLFSNETDLQTTLMPTTEDSFTEATPFDTPTNATPVDASLSTSKEEDDDDDTVGRIPSQTVPQQESPTMSSTLVTTLATTSTTPVATTVLVSSTPLLTVPPPSTTTLPVIHTSTSGGGGGGDVLCSTDTPEGTTPSDTVLETTTTTTSTTLSTTPSGTIPGTPEGDLTTGTQPSSPTPSPSNNATVPLDQRYWVRTVLEGQPQGGNSQLYWTNTEKALTELYRLAYERSNAKAMGELKQDTDGSTLVTTQGPVLTTTDYTDSFENYTTIIARVRRDVATEGPTRPTLSHLLYNTLHPSLQKYQTPQKLPKYGKVWIPVGSGKEPNVRKLLKEDQKYNLSPGLKHEKAWILFDNIMEPNRKRQGTEEENYNHSDRFKWRKNWISLDNVTLPDGKRLLSQGRYHYHDTESHHFDVYEKHHAKQRVAQRVKMKREVLQDSETMLDKSKNEINTKMMRGDHKVVVPGKRKNRMTGRKSNPPAAEALKRKHSHRLKRSAESNIPSAKGLQDQPMKPEPYQLLRGGVPLQRLRRSADSDLPAPEALRGVPSKWVRRSAETSISEAEALTGIPLERLRRSADSDLLAPEGVHVRLQNVTYNKVTNATELVYAVFDGEQRPILARDVVEAMDGVRDMEVAVKLDQIVRVKAEEYLGSTPPKNDPSKLVYAVVGGVVGIGVLVLVILMLLYLFKRHQRETRGLQPDSECASPRSQMSANVYSGGHLNLGYSSSRDEKLDSGPLASTTRDFGPPCRPSPSSSHDSFTSRQGGSISSSNARARRNLKRPGGGGALRNTTTAGGDEEGNTTQDEVTDGGRGGGRRASWTHGGGGGGGGGSRGGILRRGSSSGSGLGGGVMVDEEPVYSSPNPATVQYHPHHSTSYSTYSRLSTTTTPPHHSQHLPSTTTTTDPTTSQMKANLIQGAAVPLKDHLGPVFLPPPPLIPPPEGFDRDTTYTQLQQHHNTSDFIPGTSLPKFLPPPRVPTIINNKTTTTTTTGTTPRGQPPPAQIHAYDYDPEAPPPIPPRLYTREEAGLPPEMKDAQVEARESDVMRGTTAQDQYKRLARQPSTSSSQLSDSGGSTEGISGVPNVSRLRRRFHDLLDDAFSLLNGQRPGDKVTPLTTPSPPRKGRAKSAAIQYRVGSSGVLQEERGDGGGLEETRPWSAAAVHTSIPVWKDSQVVGVVPLDDNNTSPRSAWGEGAMSSTMAGGSGGGGYGGLGVVEVLGVSHLSISLLRHTQVLKDLVVVLVLSDLPILLPSPRVDEVVDPETGLRASDPAVPLIRAIKEELKRFKSSVTSESSST